MPGPVAVSVGELGGLITGRRRRAFYVTVSILLGLLAVLLGGAGIAIALTAPGPRSSPPDPVLWSVMIGVGALLLVCSVFLLMKSRVSLHFYERGVVKRVGARDVLVMPYERVADLQFSLTRQHVHGMYVGTIVRLRIIGEDKRKIVFEGGYKSKAKGLFRKTYESTDELEAVKDLICRAMVDSLQDDLLDGRSIEWCGAASLSAEGLTPFRGRRKKQLIPFASIDRQSMDAGSLSLLHAGEQKPFVTLSINAMNFWPCYHLFLQMADLHAAIQAEDGAPS